MSSKTGVPLHSSVAWLSAINRGPRALRDFLDRRGLDHHGPDGLGMLSWIQNQHRHDGPTRYRLMAVALDAGLKPAGPPKAAVSPLLTACMALDARAMALLLAAGADPDRGGAGKAAPLPLEPVVQHTCRGSGPSPDAITARAHRLAQLLLDAGADPNRAPRDGRHVLDELILSLPDRTRTAAIGRFLDLFWEAGCQWQEGWNEVSIGPSRTRFPHVARMRCTQAEQHRLELATAPAPKAAPSMALRL